MKYAIIESGVVVNIAKADAALAENWIEAGAAKIGDSWDGETFTSPPKPPAYATAAEARRAMVGWIDGLTSQVMDQYPRAVQARWSIEEAAARAVKADNATADQLALVTTEGAAKGRTPPEHADAIIGNADRFRAIADETNKLFLATDKALADATGPEQYEAILDGAIAQAGPLAEAYELDL
jgi:hypothetical protein